MNPLNREIRRPRLFWAKVNKQTAHNACWLWTGCDNGSGPQFRDGRRVVSAQWYAMRDTGHPVPTGTPVVRTCGSRLCVRPSHCTTGHEAVAKASAMNRKRIGKKINAYEAGLIRRCVERGAKQTEISSLFGISQASVSRICAGLSWGEG